MTHPDIRVRDLTFHYPDGKMALRQVSFEVPAGQSVGLIGPNGAGKSTLLLHLNGILPGRGDYEHHHGHGNGHVHSHNGEARVWIAGIPVVGRNLPAVRRRVGLVFQDPDDQLFCPTVFEDVIFGPRNHGLDQAAASEVARQSLEAVGLSGYEDRMPHHLSLGEKKRICFATVLACQPSTLALDEPSGNLDPAARRGFIELLRAAPASKIIATHDLELVLDLCDRVLLLAGGELIADGPTNELLADEPLLTSHGLEVPLSLRLRR